MVSLLDHGCGRLFEKRSTDPEGYEKFESHEEECLSERTFA